MNGCVTELACSNDQGDDTLIVLDFSSIPYTSLYGVPRRHSGRWTRFGSFFFA